ncbi:MAG: hypothetical protein HOW73_34410 [Polyangiaceae bacterium]|nr:hypothetical protein [Polyangiaceae bacterium]
MRGISALVFVLLCVPSAAFAREFRVQDIPNGDTFTCLNCHGELEAKTFSKFGTQARQHLLVGGPVQEAHVDWTSLCPLDADQDGKTNGEELGDPDCTWVAGDPDPGGPVTNPGKGGAAQVCGNGHLDDGEDCEGSDLHQTDCLAVDAGIGELACTAECTYDYSDCSKPPPGWEDDGGDDSAPVEEEGCSATGRAPSALAALLAAGCLAAAITRRRRC